MNQRTELKCFVQTPKSHTNIHDKIVNTSKISKFIHMENGLVYLASDLLIFCNTSRFAIPCLQLAEAKQMAPEDAVCNTLTW